MGIVHQTTENAGVDSAPTKKESGAETTSYEAQRHEKNVSGSMEIADSGTSGRRPPGAAVLYFSGHDPPWTMRLVVRSVPSLAQADAGENLTGTTGISRKLKRCRGTCCRPQPR